MRARCDVGTCKEQEEQEQQYDASAGQLFPAQASPPLMDNSLLRPLHTFLLFLLRCTRTTLYVFVCTSLINPFPVHTKTKFVVAKCYICFCCILLDYHGTSLQCITLFQQHILSLITLLGISAPVQLLPAVPPGEDVAHLPSLAILTLTTD